jgi:DNA-binding CsgD family transcriptional regulator
LAAVQEALVIAEELVAGDNLNLGYTHLSLLLVLGGRLEAAAAIALDGHAMGEALGGIRLNGAAINSAEALVALGRYGEAEELLLDLGDLVGNCAISPTAVRAAVALRRGDVADAESHVDAIGAMTSHLSDVQFRGGYHALAARLALETDRPTDGTEHIETVLALGAGTDDPKLVAMMALGVRALADTLDDSRRHGRRIDVDKLRLRAGVLVREAERIVDSPLDDGGQCLPEPAAWLATASAEASRLTASDPELWAAAARNWEELSCPYESAYCRAREAEAVLQAKGPRRRAADAAERAWRASVDIGATRLAARVERLAQRARISLTPAGADVDADPTRRVAQDLQLTAREAEVLGQLVRGHTDRQIADELYISKKTASVHVSNILRKLDVSSRFDAAEIGRRAGL